MSLEGDTDSTQFTLVGSKSQIYRSEVEISEQLICWNDSVRLWLDKYDVRAAMTNYIELKREGTRKLLYFCTAVTLRNTLTLKFSRCEFCEE